MSTQQPPLLLALVAITWACGGAPTVDEPADVRPEPVAEFDRMPSGVAVHGDRVFLSFPRWVEDGNFTVAELVDGQLVAYPSAEANAIESGVGALHSVNGMHMDSRGWLWILDNARLDLRPAADGAPKLVVWDTVNAREVFRHVFDPTIAPPGGSFLNDIVVDEDHGFAYITESGMGGTPCLIAYEIHRDSARRVLEGHESVSPDPEREMRIDGETVMLHRPDGPVVWRVAANAIGLEPGGDSLLYGPMTSDALFRVPSVMLRDQQASEEERAAAVERWATKPISDGMGVGPDGAVFITDVENEAIVFLGPEPTVFAEDPRFSFPVAIEVTDDSVWFTSNQLHRMPLLLAGTDEREPPYFLWRIPR
jgi:sugar lactone lactonase YvrE